MNLIGNASCRGLELVNTTFQHKNKHEDAGVNDNINHTIVENSNDYDGNVTMITNNDKRGKKIVTSRKIFDAEIVKDTNSITFRKNTLSKSVIETTTPNKLERGR